MRTAAADRATIARRAAAGIMAVAADGLAAAVAADIAAAAGGAAAMADVAAARARAARRPAEARAYTLKLRPDSDPARLARTAAATRAAQ